MRTTNWQRKDVTQHYLEQVRGGIPFGAEQDKLMLQVIKHFNPMIEQANNHMKENVRKFQRNTTVVPIKKITL